MNRRTFLSAAVLCPGISGAVAAQSLGAPGSAGGAVARVPEVRDGATARDAGFFFRDGDRVVMIGDSITEQHLHSNYVEIYVRSRFPHWKLAFRNVGIGGDTSAGGNRRAARDILTFEPSAVTITFGMNDAGYRRPEDPVRREAYVRGLQGMADQLKPRGVRVAVLSSSPVEEKDDGPAMQGYNETLERFAAAAREVADRNGFRFTDQFHPHVAALQRARDVDPKRRINGGDAVHPGQSGQYLMAWAILRGLGAPDRIASATVDAVTGRVVEAENCAMTAVRTGGGGVHFVRGAGALPLWIAPAGRSILEWVPLQEELNACRLRVIGLEPRTYELRVDGEPCGAFRGPDLALGVNLAGIWEGPLARQAQAVHDAVFAKNRYYHDQIFRGVVLNNQVPPEQKDRLIREREAALPALEQAIASALAPRPHLFELRPAA